MAAISIPRFKNVVKKARPHIVLDRDMAFLDSIESSWKGHERFAAWLVQQVKPRTTVDLGFDRGLSTLAFAYRNHGDVFGVDWFEEGNYAVKSYALDSAFRSISDAIRYKFARNIHLIIGPFSDVSKKWRRKIDILHIDWAHTYQSVRKQYDLWSPYLKCNGIVLIHDVTLHKIEVGRFFGELDMPKIMFPHCGGLGIASRDQSVIDLIRKKWDPQQFNSLERIIF